MPKKQCCQSRTLSVRGDDDGYSLSTERAPGKDHSNLYTQSRLYEWLYVHWERTVLKTNSHGGKNKINTEICGFEWMDGERTRETEWQGILSSTEAQKQYVPSYWYLFGRAIKGCLCPIPFHGSKYVPFS